MQTARGFDIFSYVNDDFLTLIAGGNSGNEGPNSIGSPATAKNILAIGASCLPGRQIFGRRKRSEAGSSQ